MRHQASWRIFLPASSEARLLAIDLGYEDLLCLCRAGQRVHVSGGPRGVVQRIQKQLAVETGGGERVTTTSLAEAVGPFDGIAMDLSSDAEKGVSQAAAWLAPGGTLVVVGRGKHVRRGVRELGRDFEIPRHYAVLPPASGKLTLPLTPARVTRSALRMYVPGSRWKRYAGAFAKCLSRCGLSRLLAQRGLAVVRRKASGGHAGTEPGYFFSWLERELGWTVGGVALYVYTGAYDAAKVGKLTVQLLDDRGHVLGVLKQSDAAAGGEKIRQEVAALTRLEGEAGFLGMVPRVLLEGEKWGRRFFVQSAVTSRRASCPERLTSAHVRFLARLASVDLVEKPLEEWSGWRPLSEWTSHVAEDGSAGGVQLGAHLEACRRSLSGIWLPFHRVHGDFARSNVLLGGASVSVVDWEESHDDGLPFLDMVHFGLRQLVKYGEESLPVTALLQKPGRTLGVERAVLRLAAAAPELERFARDPGRRHAVLVLCVLLELKRQFESLQPAAATVS